MASDEQHRAADLAREQFPDLREDIGEDPARFLDHDLLDDVGMRDLALTRIESIDKLAVISAWRAVERRLDRQTRQAILDALDEREADLEELGERPDRLGHGPRRPPSWFDSASESADDEPRNAHERLQRMRGEKA